jgi:uncharacterized protein YqgC (DUF456 family)
LVYAAIAVWAAVEHTVVSWVVLGVVTVVLGASLLTKYLWPARRMRAAEVGRWTLTAGAVLGVIGFFVVPVVGLLLGFVLGVYLAELAARCNQRRAWAATVHALKAVALSVGVELAGGLIAAALWVVGLVLTQ